MLFPLINWQKIIRNYKGIWRISKKENIFLIKEVNELEDPERIIKIATEKFGMKFPQKPTKKLELE